MKVYLQRLQKTYTNNSINIIHTYVLPRYLTKNLSFITVKGGMTDVEEYIIKRVKRMREERGISQAELADMLNLSRGFIGDVENPSRRAKYNLNHINELAKLFNCSFSDFFPPNPF